VITGFNTDIKHNEKVYHIQTEDKGLQNPYIESTCLRLAGRSSLRKKTYSTRGSRAGGVVSMRRWNRPA